MSLTIGITERGDAALDTSWQNEKVDIYILVTKAPRLLPEDLPDQTIIHCTITGYGRTWLEPQVSLASWELDAYKQLVMRYGPRRVVLRVDPIIPQGEWWERSLEVVRQAEGRLRVSFIDAYDHARWRIKQAGHDPAEIFPWEGFHAPLELRKQRLEEIEQVAATRPHTSVEVCGEPELPTEGCVSVLDVLAVGRMAEEVSPLFRPKRPGCTCLMAKRELLAKRKPRPCPHGCLYCYWKDW